MARKTVKQIKEKSRRLTQYKYECLLRHPDYEKDCERYFALEESLQPYLPYDSKTGEQTGDVIFPNEKDAHQTRMEMAEILKKYKTTIMAHSDFGRGFDDLSDKNYAVVPYENWMGEGLIDFDNAHKQVSNGNPIKFIIDVSRDNEDITAHLKEWLKVIRKRKMIGSLSAKKKGRQKNNLKRYLMVFDYRNQKPPLTFEQIASRLLNLYPKAEQKNLETIINNCKKDYSTVYEDIYGFKYNKKNKKESELKGLLEKSCSNCSARNKCKEKCANIEYILQSLTSSGRGLLTNCKDEELEIE